MDKKQQLINFLRGKTTTFTFEEILQIIAIIESLPVTDDSAKQQAPKKKDND